MKQQYKKLLSNTGLFAIGSFSSSLLGLLFVPFYTSVLSTADYGVSDLITTTTSLLYPFASLAISEAIMRFALDKDSDKKSIYSCGIFTVLVGFLVVLALSPVIRRTVIGPYIIYFLLYFLCYSLHTITSYFTKGIEKVKIYAVTGILNTLIVILCNLVFLLWLKIGIRGYLLSSIIGHISTTLIMFFSAKTYRYLEFPWKIDKSLYRKMLSYSIPVIPNSISWWIANSSDKYVLKYYATVSEVGIYAVSYKIPTIVMTVMGFFISAWQLSAVSCFESDDAKNMFRDVYEKCMTINFLVASGLIVTSKIFGSFLYAKDFFTAWKYVPALVMANVFNVQATFLGSVYTSAKKTKMLSATTMIAAATNVALNFALIPSFGAIGAAIATAASYFVMWIARLINTRTIFCFEINLKRDAGFFVVLLILCILTYMDSTVTWCAVGIIAIVIIMVFRKMIIEIAKTILGGIVGKLSGRG